jgi:hypothetical protein
MNGNKSKIAGILSIVSGAFGILGFVALMFVVAVIGMTNGLFSNDLLLSGMQETQVIGFLQAIYIVSGIISLILGILGIVGGIFSIRRKAWGLALAGAIAGIFTFLPTGIAAVIYIAIGKDEFSSSNQQFSPPQP